MENTEQLTLEELMREAYIMGADHYSDTNRSDQWKEEALQELITQANETPIVHLLDLPNDHEYVLVSKPTGEVLSL